MSLDVTILIYYTYNCREINKHGITVEELLQRYYKKTLDEYREWTLKLIIKYHHYEKEN